MADETPVGLTREAGWQIGVRRTVRAPLEEVWEYLTSPAGLALWLGEDVRLGTARGDVYEARDGTRGELRSRRRHDRIRLTWRPADWDHDSTLQVTTQATPTGTAVRFHQERLASAEERARMRDHWAGVLAAMKSKLERTGGNSPGSSNVETT